MLEIGAFPTLAEAQSGFGGISPICRSRITSSGDILRLRRAHDFIPEVAA